MHRPRIVLFPACLLSLGLLGPLACSDEADAPPGQLGGGSGSGHSGVGGALGRGGSVLIATGGAGATGGMLEGCEAQTEPARLTPVNIVFVIDKSGSMGIQDIDGDGVIDESNNEWDHSAERWNPVRDALVAFFQAPGAEGLAASLEFFPQGSQPTAPDTGVCAVSQYSTPAVSLQSLDDEAGRAMLVTRIGTTVPSGGTPTLPALQGALEYAAKLILDDPSSQSVVVLVTDGEPGVAAREPDTGAVVNQKCFCYGEPGCPEEDEIPHVAAAAQAGARDQGIPTYVIGMGEVDAGNLHLIAAAGGTEQAFIVSLGDPAQTQAEFTAALGNVRSVQAPCNIEMPNPPPGESFDKWMVNVEYVQSSGLAQPLFYAGPHAAEMGSPQLSCPPPGPPAPANPWFWTYDDEANPTQIVLCPSACNMATGDADARIHVAYGCEVKLR